MRKFLVTAGCYLLLVLPVSPTTVTQRLETKVLELINGARAKQHLTALTSDNILSTAARNHSESMANHDFFDHTSPIAREAEVEDRVALAGGHSGTLSENLYWSSGFSDAAIPGSVMKEWLASPEHREPMLSSGSVTVGIGVARKGAEVWATAVFSDT